jgi:hypothetical protein
VVVAGTPEQVAVADESYTGLFLRRVLDVGRVDGPAARPNTRGRRTPAAVG